MKVILLLKPLCLSQRHCINTEIIVNCISGSKSLLANTTQEAMALLFWLKSFQIKRIDHLANSKHNIGKVNSLWFLDNKSRFQNLLAHVSDISLGKLVGQRVWTENMVNQVTAKSIYSETFLNTNTRKASEKMCSKAHSLLQSWTVSSL